MAAVSRCGGEPLQLGNRLVVAGKQDHAADQRMLEALDFLVAQFQAGDIDHHGTEWHG